MAATETSKLLPQSSPSHDPTNSWRLLFYVNVFFSCASFSIILPSLEPYLARNGATPYFYGLTVAVYSVGEMVGAIVFGKVYEKWTAGSVKGAKYTLLSTIALGIIGSSLYVLGDVFSSPNMVFFGRLLQGLWTGGKQVVEQTYLSETAPPERVTELTSELGSFAILGFVCGPSFGALFTGINVSYFNGTLIFDAYTSPGWFILALCIIIFGLVIWCFNPAASPGYGGEGEARNGAEGGREGGGSRENGGVSVNGGGVGGLVASSVSAPPNSTGLAVLLIIFVIHFFSFAIQETVTTPYVLAAYHWSQTDVNLLFVGVGIISLITSFGIKYLSRVVSDFNMLLISLVIGLAGSLLLIDSLPFTQAQTLPLDRFFLGFALITVAFPFGRNVSLAVFSQLLGPTPQGQWFGYMFAAGAIPRILGPSWSLYALDLACRIEELTCFLGGRTWLEFGTSSLFFAAGIALAVSCKKDLRPYGAAEERKGRSGKSVIRV